MNATQSQPSRSPQQGQSAPQPNTQNQYQMYCRSCGKLVNRTATVCVHCGYVLNPEAFRQTQQFVRQRGAIEEGKRRVAGIFGVQPPPSAQRPAMPPTAGQYHFETNGVAYCPNCGIRVDEGASICVNCQQVLNPVALREAQEIVLDRTATLDRSDLVKSYLVPFYGHRMYVLNRDRRPQIAKPCRIGGIVNTTLTLLLILLLFILLF